MLKLLYSLSLLRDGIFAGGFMIKLDNIRVPRRPWNELVLEHEGVANVGEVAAKYNKFICKVMAGLAEKEKQVRNWKVPELKTSLQARGISVSNNNNKSC